MQDIVRKIKQLKIQGAHQIALTALEALHVEILKDKSKDSLQFIKKIKNLSKLLMNARPTEPYVMNSLNLCFKNIKGNLKETKEIILHNIRYMINKSKLDQKKIAFIGAKKILKNSIIYTHCHSSTVISILKEAKKNGKKFYVHNTETKPLQQGRITARELSKIGIPVDYYVDSALRTAIKKADMVLLGADAITAEGDVFNKIGSGIIAELAQKMNIPLYICTSSLKFDPRTIQGYPEPIEERSSSEIWKNPPKNIQIHNPAFEIIEPELIDGVITELGIFAPQVLVQEIRRAYPEIFVSY